MITRDIEVDTTSETDILDIIAFNNRSRTRRILVRVREE
jgi:hypothetical protein